MCSSSAAWERKVGFTDSITGSLGGSRQYGLVSLLTCLCMCVCLGHSDTSALVTVESIVRTVNERESVCVRVCISLCVCTALITDELS